MLDTENMQIVSRLLAITLERWCSHRAAKKDQSIAAAPSAAPSEVLTPLVRIGHQQFILHNILPAQALEEWTPP
jgi:hypothetical protein